MNKKFSTLVAALLVSGVSYAVVGAMDAQPMLSSPIAKAAAANLRASSLAPTQSVVLTDKLVAGDFEGAEIITSKVWTVTEVISGSNILTVDGEKAFLSGDGSLSDDFNNVGTSKVDLSTTGNYVTVGDKYLILSKEGITVRTATDDDAAKASLKQGEQLVKAYLLNNSAPATTLAAGTSYLLGGELAPKVPTALAFITDPAPAVFYYSKTTTTSGNENPGDNAAFTLVKPDNNKEEYFLVAENGQFVKYNEDLGGLEGVADVKDASPISLDGSYNLIFGVDKYLVISGGDVVVNDGQSGDKVVLYDKFDSSPSQVTTLAAMSKVYITLGDPGSGATSFVTFGLKPSDEVSLENQDVKTHLYNLADSLQFTASTQKLTYTAKDGVTYEFMNAAETAGTEIEFASDNTGSNYQIGANGELMSDGGDDKYIVLKDGKLVLADAAATGGTQIYVWLKADAASLPVLGTVGINFGSGTVILSTSNTKVGNTIVAGDNYLTFNLAQNVMQLVDGANYYLRDNKKENCLIPAGTADAPALGNLPVTGVQPNTLDGLWKATAYKNDKGVVTHYSFKYRNDEAMNLAFDVKYDREISEWVISYNPEGKYTRFVVDEKGFIIFTADEKATVKGEEKENKKQYALYFNGTTKAWTIDEYSKTAEQLDIEKAEDIIITGDEAAKQVEWLNVTAGNGVGFGVFYVNDSKKVDLQENVMTKNQITAVQGPDLTYLGGTQENLNNKVFLRVSGEYKYVNLWSGASAAEKKANAERQLKAFRESKFVVVDTVLYSGKIQDEKDYFYLVEASGADMISAKGYHANQAATYADLTDKNGNFVGLKRRLENAQFEIHHPKGSIYTDPVYFEVPNAMMPVDQYNEKGLINSSIVGNNDGYARFDVDGTAAPLFLAVKYYDKKYYLGAANAYSELYISKNNDVDYTKVNGIVNIISRNYKTDGQVYANADYSTDNTYIVKLLPKYVCLDKPEGQFLVTGGNYNEFNEIQPFRFTNRESGNYYSSVALKSVTDENGKVRENIYAWVGSNDTIEIRPVALTDEYVGYKNYSKKDLDNTEYVLKFVSNAGGVEDLYITENHNADHSLGMHRDTAYSAKFKLVKFEGEKDTIFVSDRAYSYINDDKEYSVDKKDKVVTFKYAIYNADNKEFLSVNNYKGELTEDYYYCNPDLKYDGTNARNALMFVLKEKADGTIQLIPTYSEGFTSNSSYKLYAGVTDNKIYAETSIYKRTDNDLFKIVPVGAPMYRTVEAAPFDTLRIYKEGMDNVALFAETAEKSIVSGEHFLGMTHQADKDLKKTMFSLFVDTAYVNREDNYKPQYMLVLDADTVHGKYTCNDPSHDPHISAKIDTVFGKYLIAMDDSAAVWRNAGKHNNPYEWDQYPRLGFVNAKHYGDSLVVIRDNGIQSHRDTIDLANNADVQGVFAFRIVDQEAKSFKMETGLYRNAKDEFRTGWVKWLNGKPVVVTDMDQAEVFNFEATAKNPTANDAISANGVSVAAIDGAVIVKGAAGKTVAITNVLGQTIANVVLSSDNETIAAPAGVVVVAVEGEAAVKAIVK